MKTARILLILFAAILCVAATSLAHQGPGKSTSLLYYCHQTDEAAGHVDVWNNGKKFDDAGEDIGSNLMVQVTMDSEAGWYMGALHVQAGFDDIPVNRTGAARPGHFNCQMEFEALVSVHVCSFDLEDDFDFSWGSRHDRAINVAVHVEAVHFDTYGVRDIQEGAWARPEDSWTQFNRGWGWWYTYELAHPMRYHFNDAPVKGHGYKTPTHEGVAGDDEKGGFWGFPGEWTHIFIGSPNDGFYVGTAELAGK